MSRPIPPRPGLGAPDRRLAEILRVDQAGEVAAVQIYRGHQAVLAKAKGGDALASHMGRLEAEEAEHLARFDALLNEHRVRPTLLAPLWRLAAFGLGAGAALIGEKAVHACTEAVETVIEEHYAGQIAELERADPALAQELSAFRADELAHRDEALELGATSAPAYPLLAAVVRAGCRAAIKISEKI